MKHKLKVTKELWDGLSNAHRQELAARFIVTVQVPAKEVVQ